MVEMNPDPMVTPVPTPCIGVCSTVFGDHVCRGCKRYVHEIIAWNGYSAEQKLLVERRLGQLLTQVLVDKWRVLDSKQLAARLKRQGVRFSIYRDPVCWVLDLLRLGAQQINDPRQWGFEILPAWRHLDLPALREQVDQEFFRLSEAHYARYLLPVPGAETVSD